MGKIQRRVVVDVEQDDENHKTDIFILFPEGQSKISIKETANILGAAISLLIRNSSNEAELIRQIKENLDNEFISARSFEDSFLNEELFIESEKKKTKTKRTKK